MKGYRSLPTFDDRMHCIIVVISLNDNSTETKVSFSWIINYKITKKKTNIFLKERIETIKKLTKSKTGLKLTICVVIDTKAEHQLEQMQSIVNDSNLRKRIMELSKQCKTTINCIDFWFNCLIVWLFFFLMELN